MQQTSISLDPEERAMLEEELVLAQGTWEVFRRSGTPSEKGNALLYLSNVLADLEGPETALRLSRRAFRCFQQTGCPIERAEGLAVLAFRLLETGRTREGLRRAREALAACRAIEPRKLHDGIINQLADLLLRSGHHEEGRAGLELAMACRHSFRHGGMMESLARLLPIGEARHWQAMACAAHRADGFIQHEARALITLARMELALGRPWEAEALCREVQTLSPSTEETILAASRELARLALGRAGATPRRLLEGPGPVRGH